MKDEFKITKWTPELVSESDINNAFKIITFDCQLPPNVNSKKIEEWNGTPSISKDYDQARDIIKEKINQFIETLPKKFQEQK